jgi:hypothetical protein
MFPAWTRSTSTPLTDTRSSEQTEASNAVDREPTDLSSRIQPAADRWRAKPGVAWAPRRTADLDHNGARTASALSLGLTALVSGSSRGSAEHRLGLVDQLVKVAPQWLLLVLVGLAMVGAGGLMIS